MVLNSIGFSYFLSNQGGFGLNTDIFETNVINLSVVIGILVYYGRIALADIINSRKADILKSLQEAENKFKEAEENLLVAKKNFESSRIKAEQIRQQGSLLSSQTVIALLAAVEDDIKRLKLSNLSIIKLEEEKSVNQLCQKLTQIALFQAKEKISKKMNVGIQKKIIVQSIERLSTGI